MQPASYSIPGDIRATLARILVYMGGLALLAVAAAGFVQSERGPLASIPSPNLAWTAAEKPYPAFELLMPEFNGSAFNYAILRRSADNARKDVMTWGEPAIRGPLCQGRDFPAGPTAGKLS